MIFGTKCPLAHVYVCMHHVLLPNATWLAVQADLGFNSLQEAHGSPMA